MNDFLTMKDLEQTAQKYYKITKSSKEIAKKCYKDNYLNYKPNEIITDVTSNGLSFVSREHIILFIIYGDQLTEIIN